MIIPTRSRFGSMAGGPGLDVFGAIWRFLLLPHFTVSMILLYLVGGGMAWEYDFSSLFGVVISFPSRCSGSQSHGMAFERFNRFCSSVKAFILLSVVLERCSRREVVFIEWDKRGVTCQSPIGLCR